MTTAPEHTARRRRSLGDRFMTRAITIGLFPSTDAVIETVGRVSGRRRRTAVGNGLCGDTFWLVAEHEDAQYVQNLRAEPTVRVLVGRRWHRGTAVVLPEDDAWARRAELDRGRGLFRRIDGRTFRARATRPLTIRIDIEPA